MSEKVNVPKHVSILGANLADIPIQNNLSYYVKHWKKSNCSEFSTSKVQKKGKDG